MRLTNWFAPAVIPMLAALSMPATVSAEFPDDPLDFGILEPAEYRHTRTDPNVSRLFFMPTFETLPQGQANIGTIELLSVHGSFSPLSSVQIGGAIVPWAAGIASVGAKLRLWRSADRHVGVAVGGNYTSLNWEQGRDGYDAMTTGYVVAGYSGDRGQAQFGLFMMGTRSVDNVYFAPYPQPDLSNRHVEEKQHVFVAFGLSIPVKGNTQAMLELWGIDADDSWPITLPGFRFFENSTSFEVIPAPIWFDEGRFHSGLPIFNVTHHFR
jgi:hypothetical protein